VKLRGEYEPRGWPSVSLLRGDQKVVGSDSAEHAAEYVSLIPASLRRSDGFGLTLGDRGAGRSLLSDSQEMARRDAVDRP